MSHYTPHRVKKAVFNMQFSDEQTAFKGRKRLVDFFSNSLLPILENAFDTYTQSEQIYQIHRLEFDLGYLDLEQLDPSLMRQKILRQLNRQWQEQSPETVTVVTTSRSLEETFMRFLATGVFTPAVYFQQYRRDGNGNAIAEFNRVISDYFSCSTSARTTSNEAAFDLSVQRHLF